MAEPNDFFRPEAGQSAGRGLRRLNRVPILIVMGMAGVVVAIVGYTVYDRAQEMAVQVHEQPVQSVAKPADSAGALANAPTSGIVEPRKPAAPTPGQLSPLAAAANAAGGVGGPANANGQNGLTPEEQARRTAWLAYQQDLHDNAQRIRSKYMEALSAPTTVQGNQGGGDLGAALSGALTGAGGARGLSTAMGGNAGGATGGNVVRASGTGSGGFTGGNFNGGGYGGAAGPSGANGGNSGGSDPNGQAAKANFLGLDPAESLQHTREDSPAPYVIRAGWVIPAVMVSGINSDLPGQIIGRVSETIYDTATGQYPLICQGSLLVGSYDNAVTFGQERILVTWNRIDYPDGSKLSLGKMPGADEAGYAGFYDEVDNHYLRIFGGAVAMSVFSSGVQLSQPQAVAGQNQTAGQTIAASLGQQLGQVGMAMAQKNLGIAPTLTDRPGYPFNVMVTKDIPFTRICDEDVVHPAVERGAAPGQRVPVGPGQEEPVAIAEMQLPAGPYLSQWQLSGGGREHVWAIPPSGGKPQKITIGGTYPVLGQIKAIYQRGDEWFVEGTNGWFSGSPE